MPLNRSIHYVQRFVCVTGQIPWLDFIYRRLYRWSQKIILGRIKRNPVVLCSLSSQLYDSNFRPGLSDIDLIIIVDIPESDPSIVLQRLWREYRLLRKFMPHFLHFEIVEVRDFTAMGRAVFGPMSITKPYLLEEYRCTPALSDRLKGAVEATQRSLSKRDQFRNGLLRYVNFYLPYIQALVRGKTYSNWTHLERLLHKISDLCVRETGEEQPKNSYRSVADLSAGIVALFEVLDCSGQRLDCGRRPATELLGPSGPIPAPLAAQVGELRDFFGGDRSEALQIILWQEPLNGPRFSLAFIVAEGQSPAERTQTLRNVLAYYRQSNCLESEWFTVNPHQWHHRKAFPMLFTQTLWKWWLEFYPLNVLSLEQMALQVVGSQKVLVPRVSLESLGDFAKVQLGVWAARRAHTYQFKSVHDRRYLIEAAESMQILQQILVLQDLSPQDELPAFSKASQNLSFGAAVGLFNEKLSVLQAVLGD